ncbi:hypothetical protein MTR_2g438240 [Medicago truncatula]|uniref:Uncharacterized protein n=1 Tax=Medicago truncatula TaxID=3880 RepID=A0A072VGY9_MEDTR|nr:hypothetical protein MTR_2g438240 [Medicago truncatula]
MRQITRPPRKALRPHPPAGESAHIEADMPDADADNTSGPLSGTHPPVTMIPLHHHTYQSSCPCLRRPA